jgi:hypothetical protein
MGFFIHNTVAVLEGLWGKKKMSLSNAKIQYRKFKDKWKQNTYISKKVSKNIIIELLLIYFLFGIYSGILE